jgi:hypothetical protein
MIEELKKILLTSLIEKVFEESVPMSEGCGDEADQAKEECSRELYLLVMT